LSKTYTNSGNYYFEAYLPSPLLAFCFGRIFTTWCPKESIVAHTNDIVKINVPKKSADFKENIFEIAMFRKLVLGCQNIA
jgi:hypothetical protein